MSNTCIYLRLDTPTSSPQAQLRFSQSNMYSYLHKVINKAFHIISFPWLKINSLGIMTWIRDLACSFWLFHVVFFFCLFCFSVLGWLWLEFHCLFHFCRHFFCSGSNENFVLLSSVHLLSLYVLLISN